MKIVVNQIVGLAQRVRCQKVNCYLSYFGNLNTFHLVFIENLGNNKSKGTILNYEKEVIFESNESSSEDDREDKIQGDNKKNLSMMKNEISWISDTSSISVKKSLVGKIPNLVQEVGPNLEIIKEKSKKPLHSRNNEYLASEEAIFTDSYAETSRHSFKSSLTGSTKDLFSSSNKGKDTKFTRFQRACERLLDKISIQIFLTIMTLIALYGDDLRFQFNDDLVFDTLLLLCFCVFLCELLFSLIGIKGYLFSFFFWLDLISLISLLTDIYFLLELLNIDDQILGIATDATEVARAGRASRAGTRAGRVLRLLRVIKLVRIAKLYNNTLKTSQSIAKKGSLSQFFSRKKSKITPERVHSESSLGSFESNSIKSWKFMTKISDDDKDSENNISNRNIDSNIKPNIKLSQINDMIRQIQTNKAPEEINNDNKSEKKSQEYEVSNSYESKKECLSPRANMNLSVNFEEKITPAFEKSTSSKNKFSFGAPHEKSSSNGAHISKHNNEYKKLESFDDENFSKLSSEVSDEYEGDKRELINILLQIEDDQDIILPKESRVSKILTQRTTRRVIIIILCLLLILPLFDLATFYSPSPAQQYGTKVIQAFKAENLEYSAVFNHLISHSNNKEFHITNLELWNTSVSPKTLYLDYNRSITNLRILEKNIKEGPGYIVEFSMKEEIKFIALLKLFKTTFVIILLIVGALLFSSDAHKYVLRPLESLVTKINKLANDPFKALKLNLMKNFFQEFDGETKKTKVGCWGRFWNGKEDEVYETEILDNTIIKICSLLVLGFGEAGCSVISTLLKEDLKESQFHDPSLSLCQIKGNKTLAIFSFCDVRNFTDVTEILEEKVMGFVNSIAKIVYSISCEYLGYPNKNIGDAFLLVFKIQESEIIKDEDGNLSVDNCNPKINNTAEFVIISVLKIIYRLNTEASISKYNNSKRINRKIPNYKIRLGFGIHFGWAIEGAIGSQFKIDATYLSPHVNLAMHLESITKTYGCPVLLTGSMYNILSSDGKQLCRGIDQLYDRKTKTVVRLFCIDISEGNETHNGMTNTKMSGTHRKNLFFKKIIERQLNIEKISDSNYRASNMFDFDQEISFVRFSCKISRKALRLYKKGLKYYIKGKWQHSKFLLSQVLNHQIDDGPSQALLKFMSLSNFVAPKEWRGCRDIKI
ncbi:unnamed protein product [Moneuplotes crassus]|uniref:Guanylate cyclase domain-containing protein n=1 Tax=Euplotes crassus TaxID=5936 RepID=A0AAD1U3F5_EUPCR|nr:unnamed protein product [Moneuplotes crassus]